MNMDSPLENPPIIPNEITNEYVLRVFKDKGPVATAQFLVDIFNSNTCVKTLKRSFSRLLDKHKNHLKHRNREINLGIAGNEGTYDHWAKQLFKMPEPPGETAVPTHAPSPSEKSITRSEYPDLRGRLEYTENMNLGMHSKIESLEMKAEERNKELKRTRSRESFHRKKAVKLEEKIVKKQTADINLQTELGEECCCSKYKEQILNLKEEVKDLNIEINKLRKSKTHFENNTVSGFKDNFRILTYNLLEQHVGLEHITPVIKAVFQYSTPNYTYDKFPSERSYRRMNLERLKLSQIQIAEDFCKEENTCLYSDETSKKSEKYINFNATTSDKRYYVLGIRDLATKSANETFNTFEEILPRT